MATNATAINQSAVITGSGAADSIALTGNPSQKLLEVLNVDGAAPISFRVDGTTAVTGAAENYCVPGAAGAKLIIPVKGSAGSHQSVSIITTAKYQVSLVPAHQYER